MVTIQREPALAANEGRTAAQLQQKGLQLRYQRFFQLALVQVRHFRELQRADGRGERAGVNGRFLRRTGA